MGVGRKLTALALLAAATFALAARAGDYPDRPVRIITASPGTLMDVVARHVADRLSKRWGQPVVVENRGGAAFTIGMATAAQAKPDGYTLVMSDRTALASAPHLYKDLAYDSLKDFAPVSMIATAPLILIAHPSVPADNMRELVEFARNHAGLQFGSQGMSTTGHYAGELLRVEAGIHPEYVHYKGAADAQRAILGGEILVGFNNAPSTYGLVAAKRLKGFAVTSRERIAAAPDIPTTAEAGFPGVEIEYWVGLLAPKATPQALVKKINYDISQLLYSQELRQAMLIQGAEVAAVATPDNFAARIRRDYARSKRDFEKIGFHAE
jgi:tripartite-type tricarboxylate transporter receptor subunit TctC